MDRRARATTFDSGWRLKPLAAAIVAAGAFGSTDGRAAALTVTTLAEASGSACTLRDAVDSVNAGSDQGACVATGAYGSADSVSFDPALSGTLTFFNADPLAPTSALAVQRPIVILGPGSGALTLACGSSSFRLMEIDAGVAAASLSGLTIAGCSAPGNGGGILADVQTSNVALTLQLTDVTLTGNHASSRGGGLALLSGAPGATVTLTACDLRSNTAASHGAGLALSDASGGAGTVASVSDSTIAANTATQLGGGAYVAGGGVEVTFTRSTIDNNRASAGGGIELDGGAGLTLLDSTLSNNRATGNGGGARLLGSGTGFQAVNSTLSGNQGGRGGGVYALGIGAAGLLSLANTTVANNRATFGGGVAMENTYSGSLITPANVVSIVDTIIAGNLPTPDIVSNEPNIVGGVLPWNASYSVIGGSGTVMLDGTGNITDGAVPAPFGAGGWLGALQNYGGPTLTHALLTTVPDPAIDAGDPAFSGLAYDQRGPPFKRVRDGRVDIGAYESGQARSRVGAAAPVPGPGGLALALLSGLLSWLGWRLRPRR